jgi:hypothetical protein
MSQSNVLGPIKLLRSRLDRVRDIDRYSPTIMLLHKLRLDPVAARLCLRWQFETEDDRALQAVALFERIQTTYERCPNCDAAEVPGYPHRFCSERPDSLVGLLPNGFTDLDYAPDAFRDLDDSPAPAVLLDNPDENTIHWMAVVGITDPEGIPLCADDHCRNVVANMGDACPEHSTTYKCLRCPQPVDLPNILCDTCEVQVERDVVLRR